MVNGGILKAVDKELPKRYLPLLAVIDLQRDSTKIRVCLDGKSRYHGLSFNDALFKGKLEMTDVMEIIT